MPRSRTAILSLTNVLDRSSRPVYAVDPERQIVYCNTALSTWLGLEPQAVLGRYVEYHSLPVEEEHGAHAVGRSLTGLCPPPSSLAGEQSLGTVSCIGHDGRLLHRRAEFVPLDALEPGGEKRRASSVLVLLAERDMSPQDLEIELAGEPTGDELHRAIRRFRRNEASQFALEALLGDAPSIRQVRAQVQAAAESGANVVIVGRPGSGRERIARTIHYRVASDLTSTIVPIDCKIVTEDAWRRAFDAIRRPAHERKPRTTLLLIDLDALSPEYQSHLYEVLCQNRPAARTIATIRTFAGPPRACNAPTTDDASDAVDSGMPNPILPRLLAELSTITIQVPRLVERLDDLPILAQCFLEANNRRRNKQIGALRPDALDLLALYSWPGELDELRDTIDAAHRASQSHQITPVDLPAIIHHASSAAAIATRPAPEPIVLDDFLAAIEKEIVTRAMAQSRGNKTEAARLLGLTRPRLYRRLVQLGMADQNESEPVLEEIVFEPESPGTDP